MKIVISIDSLKGSLSSIEAANAIKKGILNVDNNAEIVIMPLADGGEGTVDALVEGMNGQEQLISVTGPIGEKVTAKYGILKDTNTAIIEMAQASGLPLVPTELRNPLNTTTYGVGEIIKEAIEKGLKEFEKIAQNTSEISGEVAFRLYDTYGFPIELTQELACEQNLNVDMEGFKQKFKEHQEKSRGNNKAFKGGLAGNSETEIKYHTATHLLNAALKKVVGENVHQKGSNITSERLRFDFSCDHKLTDEEKLNVEKLVNQWISEGLEVKFEEMSKEEAINSGAECMFIEKYPDIVKVYSIGNISKELCGGPHVKNTSELDEFKIVKEEASSAGVRRIKGVFVKK